MNGNVYLRAVVPDSHVQTSTSFSDYLDNEHYVSLEEPTNLAINDMLCLLFRDGEIDFITDDLPTIALTTGNAYAELYKEAETATRQFVPRISTIPRKNDDPKYTKIERLEDTTSEMDLVELTQIVSSAIDTSKARLTVFSAKVLSDSLHTTFGRRDRIRAGREDMPTIVKGTINNNVRIVAKDLGGAGYYVDITNDDRNNTVDITAQPRSPLLSSLPNWLSSHENWDSAVQLLAAKGMLEFDVYTALVQWCADRQIGAVPIMATPEFENRFIKGDKNTNADILLCSLEGKEVIPIQVKNSMPSNDSRRRYINGMEFITPTNLGLVELSNMQQKHNGRVRTVGASTVHYGRLFSHFLNRFSGARTREQDMKALEKAYSYFDRAYLPKLRR